MAYVPNILKKGYAPAWQPKKAYKQHEFQTMDGTEYILYEPQFRNQQEDYMKLIKKYKDVFDQIKADIKDDATIVKSKDGFPYEFDYIEWAALLSSTLKKLNKTWGVNDKIWIYNKRHDRTKNNPMYLAITPKITQRNAKRAARKVSAATALATADDEAEDEEDIDLGEVRQVLYVKTKNGLTYYYYTEEDARNNSNKYFKIENSDGELVNESGKRINPDGTLMKFIRKSDFDKRQERKRSKRAWAEKQIEMGNDLWLDDYDTSREPSEGFITEDEAEDEDENESDSEKDDYDYNDGIPPYEGAMWDDEFKVWVSNPIDPEIYDEEGNYKIPPEDIVVEPEPAPAPAPIQQQESKMEKIKRLMRERYSARLPINPEPVVAMPPPAPTPAPAPAAAPAPREDPRIVEARIGLPTPWEARISNTHNIVYYFNPINQTKQWERPAEDPRIVEARIGLPPGWQPLISRSTGQIYYNNPKKGNQYERPTMGGKRTRRRPNSRQRPRPKSRAKQPKRKRTTTRRKRTTRRRK